MKKRFMLKFMVIFCLSAVFTSCNDDEPGLRLTDPAILTQKTFYGGEEDFKVTWNGQEDTRISATFAADEENPDKLQMSWMMHWSDVWPDKVIQYPDMEVDVERGVHQMTLSSTLETEREVVELTGFYDEIKFALELDIKTTMKMPELKGRSFTYRFGPDVFEVRSAGDEYLTWQGQPMRKEDFVEESLSLLMERLAQRVEAMRLTFREDYQIDLEVKRTGEVDFAPYLSLPFLVAPDLDRTLSVYVTSESEHALYRLFTKEVEVYSPAIYYEDLSIGYESDGTACALAIPLFNLKYFINIYRGGYALDELSAEEQEQIKMLYEVLKEETPEFQSIFYAPWDGTWRIVFHSSGE